jgi:hypothetical protein
LLQTRWHPPLPWSFACMCPFTCTWFAFPPSAMKQTATRPSTEAKQILPPCYALELSELWAKNKTAEQYHQNQTDKIPLSFISTQPLWLSRFVHVSSLYQTSPIILFSSSSVSSQSPAFLSYWFTNDWNRMMTFMFSFPSIGPKFPGFGFWWWQSSLVKSNIWRFTTLLESILVEVGWLARWYMLWEGRLWRRWGPEVENCIFHFMVIHQATEMGTNKYKGTDDRDMNQEHSWFMWKTSKIIATWTDRMKRHSDTTERCMVL